MRMREKSILRVVSQLFIPFILLFALYVQFHGDFGPGGGFQAGVIFAAGIVLYSLIFGLDTAVEAVSPRVIEYLVAFGVLLYAGTGIANLALGGNFLDYKTLSHHDPTHGLHYGLLAIEAGVGITVTAAMTMIFFCFAGRGRS